MHRAISAFALLVSVLLSSIAAADAWENPGRSDAEVPKFAFRESSGRSLKAACGDNSWEIFGRNIPLYAFKNDAKLINVIAQVQPPYPNNGAQYQPQFPQQGVQPYQPQFQQQQPAQQYPNAQYQPAGQQMQQQQFPLGPQITPGQIIAPNMVQNGAFGQSPGAPGFIDLNSGRFGRLDFNIVGGRFQDSSVDNLRVIASELDMSRGLLGGIDLQVTGGHFREFTIDQLRIASSGALRFSTEAFLNNRVLEFTQPINANVVVVFSQKSLNQFLSSPASLQMLSSGATNHLGGFISQIVGSALQVKFQSAAVQLMPEDRVQTDVNVLVNLMGAETAVPLSLSTRLLLQDAWISMADTRILSSGQELPQEMTNMIVSRLNKLADWGKNNPDLKMSFTQLKVFPGDRFELGGTAFIKRLRFGN